MLKKWQKKLIYYIEGGVINIDRNKVYLEEYIENGVVQWKKLSGCYVKFKYRDISGLIKVISVIRNSQELYVEYENTVSKISQDTFKHARLQYVLNYNNINGNIFKYKVNYNIKNDKRNLTVTDFFYYRTKLYKLKCNICGWDKGIASERDLNLDQYICSCCMGRTVVEGINDIPTTDPWMIPYFQGGYDEAKLYTKGSNKRIYFVCPDCKKVKSTTTIINSLFRYKSIGCICGDGISYPEKFFGKFLDLIHVKYIRQTNKTILPWSDNYKYDFYIPDFDLIIETHGEQHYKLRSTSCWDSLENVKTNDDDKYKLAIKNIKHYIVIDCSMSDKHFIKESIIKSELQNILTFNHSCVNWDTCDEYATSNLVKLVCDYKSKHNEATANDIAEIFNVDVTTVYKYLHSGNTIGWCNYDAKLALKNGAKKTKKLKYGKLLAYYDNYEYIGSFDTVDDFIYFAKTTLDKDISKTYISQVLNHKKISAKGFTFAWEKEAMSYEV